MDVIMKGALIGANLIHSYSKFIHEALGTTYDLVNIDKDDLDLFFSSFDYDFVNVTIPYKEEVLKYLDELSDAVKEIKACNLIRKENGKLVGYNTDYLGFKKMMEKNNIVIANKKVLVLGSGGASKAITYYLKENNCKYYIASRHKTLDNYISYQELKTICDDIDIIINTTPNGMYPNIYAKSLINLSDFNKVDCIIDIIYNPFRTDLIIEANNNNIYSINGIEMLVYQATYCYDCDYSIEEKALINLFYENRNIVLIGMPGSGKSTLGESLAKEYPEKDYYDVDKLIVERYGNINDIFNNEGEEKFREYEANIIKELAMKENVIISTGGGFFKTKENVRLLKMKGALYFVNTNLDTIKKNIKIDGSRPLIKEVSDIDKLYQERIKIYYDIMDYEIKD